VGSGNRVPNLGQKVPEVLLPEPPPGRSAVPAERESGMVTLTIDELCLLLTWLPLGSLMYLKRVCTLWANAVRRIVHTPEWRDAMARAPERYRRYESAQQGFESLNAGPRVDKRLLSRKCRQLARVRGVRLDRGSGEFMVHMLFKNNTGIPQLFNKSLRILQRKDSDQIYILSDVYHVDTDTINQFAFECTNAGMEVFVFEKDYEGLAFEVGYRPPRGIGMLNGGYWQFYRGKIAGIVI
jgi:hypothetical protein